MNLLPDKHRAYEIPTFPEKEYDELAWLAAKICNTPIELIFFRGKAHFLKSYHGLKPDEISPFISFYEQAIPNLDEEVFIVEDTRNESWIKDTSLGSLIPEILSYAGIALHSSTGHVLGTLIVMDRMPKKVTEDQIKSIKALGSQIINVWALKKAQFESEWNAEVHEYEKGLLNRILDERVKELKCLYAIGSLHRSGLSIEEMLTQAVACLPHGWQFPELTTAAIRYNDRVFKSPDHKKSKREQVARRKTNENKTLTITIAYHGDLSVLDSEVFLHEEQVLLEMISENLVMNINQVLAGQSNELLLQST